MKIKQCRKCQIELNIQNCAPSFLKRNINICRNCNNIENYERIIKNRKLIINNLGGKCECCRIDNEEFLSIDHINGGGRKERENFKKYKHYLKMLVNLSINELTSKYRCLCFNCNYALGFWGRCPHTLQKYNNEELLIGNRGIKNIKPFDRKRNNQLKQIARLKGRLEMIMAYGGKCISCNENNPLFLTLDHINNNGNLEIYRGYDFYQYLKRLGYPGKNTQLQLLCNNCNAYKEYTNNRKNESEIIMIQKEIYFPKKYSISKKIENELWNEARKLFALLNK